MSELWTVYLGDLQTPVLAILLMDATKYLPRNHLKKVVLVAYSYGRNKHSIGARKACWA